MYNDIVLDHFSNPRNMGEIENPDGVGQTGNPMDGDKIIIYIKISKNVLVDVRFKTFGCAAAIAASSMATVLAKGKTIDAALEISNKDVAASLGGLPSNKLQCSNIAADALHVALEQYQSQTEGKHRKVNGKISTPCKRNPDVSSLSKEEVNRYLRQIIIPQISGKGQKKINEANVTVVARDIESCDILLYYLVATGIKNIKCCFEKKCKNNPVIAHLKELDPNLHLIQLPLDKEKCIESSNLCYSIIMGGRDFIKEYLKGQEVDKEHFPGFLVEIDSWKGKLTLFKNTDDLKGYQKKILQQNGSKESPFSALGSILSSAVAGTIIVTELIKLITNISPPLSRPVYFNLIKSTFGTSLILEEDIDYDELASSITLAQKKVLIIGAGGLGCPVALTLAKAGIGTIGLIDYDRIELSNLNRQILHSTSRIGRLKVESAKELLEKINPEINIITYPYAFDEENADDMVKKYNIIVDGLDNIPTRYILNDACLRENKPFVEAGVLTFYGQITTIKPGATPCYRCFLPDKGELSPGCTERGVLGSVPGLIGVLQAIEVIKLFLGFELRLTGNILMYDGINTDFTIIPFLKNGKCICSNN